MMSDERGKDEFSTDNMIKKHERHQQEISQFADTIRDLAERAQKLVHEKTPLRFVNVSIENFTRFIVCTTFINLFHSFFVSFLATKLLLDNLKSTSRTPVFRI